ncbi:facilitated trehalose transporter Tret1 isoform X2 [Ooceraea biroi]|uniref:facilitated trehalose transporter Tret1 isoform X2 n=1 Tax=Ooceraea biroi TaxID=2015173 RepID=UPI000F08DE93|nr:facilitated trehalose transporter Tret1 isoform X2 [Ooceraea biroi]
MNKTQEIVNGNTHVTMEKDRELHDEISNFLQSVTNRTTEEKVTMVDVIPQIVCSCILHCMAIQVGINMAYATVLVDGLESDNIENIPITETEESWIVSWLLLIFADSISTIYAARVVAGIAAGLSTVGLVYIPEITHPKVRTIIMCLVSAFVSLGILITCCLAIFLDWRKIAIVFLALNCCIFFSFLYVPESPYWLACFRNGMSDKKRVCEMRRSLRRLNRKQTMYEREYSRILEAYGNRTVSDEASESVVASVKSYYHSFTFPEAYKPLTILVVLFLLQQLTGAYVVIFYAISVFREMGGTFGRGLDENSALVMLGIIRFVMSLITAFYSRRYGRRVLCIVSAIGMAIPMFLAGMYMHFTVSYDENGNLQETMVEQKWLLLFFVLSYICTSTFGFVTIPWTLIGELLPVSIRGIGASLMIAFAYLIMFAVVKSYPYILRCISIEGIFFFFSFFSLVATAFVYFFLPETLGKSFADIEKYFKKTETRNATPRRP